MYWEKKINNHIVIYSEYKYDNKQYNIDMLLSSDEFQEFISSLQQDYNIVIGWDGTMLYALKKYYKNQKKFLWINFWNKWFLLQDKKIILEKNNFTEKKYSLFEVEINGKHYGNFVNEVSINASNGKMWSFEVNIWRNETFELHWDGLIVSSVLWSSAYNSSLWWPILSHSSKTIVITPKAAWKPKHFPSIVLSEQENIEIKNIWRFHGLEIYCDGQWEKIEEKEINISIKKSQYDIIFAVSDSQLQNWENKIFQF